MSNSTVLILAAGIGSRYGGLKQIDPVGPRGEIIIDDSIHDTIRAGFGKVVWVIRRGIEQDFKEAIGNRFEDRIAVEYVFQEMAMLPEGYNVPDGRTKPWGTAQAILAAKEVIHEPFGVINADDFFHVLEARFTAFLDSSLSVPKSEYQIPPVVDEHIRATGARVQVLPTPDTRFGVTYPDDKPRVAERISEFHSTGVYPTPLWNRP